MRFPDTNWHNRSIDMATQKETRLIDGLSPCRQHECKRMPDVKHVGPDLKLNVYASCTGCTRDPDSVIHQDLCRTDLDKQGWEPGRITVNRRRERCARAC